MLHVEEVGLRHGPHLLGPPDRVVGVIVVLVVPEGAIGAPVVEEVFTSARSERY